MNKRTVFITGGASGIGFGIAEAMAKQGHHVIIADINEQAAQEAAAKLAQFEGSASAIAVDVCDAEQVAMLPEALGLLSVDVLINNAGIQHVAKLEDFPPQKWQQLINIMLVGPALLTQAFLPAMRAQNFGRII
ncbi:MAG: SDR family NAD(P)-dependent oxidoreductase, partial [Pseudomonadota bacterium]|nr:SDR family NAD(P)-dependent oxidoreductase [Pseudomonadota bacterium]